MPSISAPTPAPDRRSRRRGAREVSSRYMATPSATSPFPISSDSNSAASPRGPTPHPPFLPLPKKPLHLQRHHRPPSVPSSPASTDSESDPFVDENWHETQRKHVVRLFQHVGCDQPPRKMRPGTPMVYGTGTPRPIVSSQNHLRSANPGRIGGHGGRSELASLARANPFAIAHGERDGRSRSRETSPEKPELETCSISSNGGFCDSPPLNNCRVRVVSEFRSSMPEAELLPTMPARRSVDGGSGRQDAVSSSPCYRSLSVALSNCQKVPFNPSKSMNKPPTSLKTHYGATKTVGLCLPQLSQNTVPGIDSRKGRKALNRQEDEHSLRMLHNSYLQWRLVNAKAQAAVHARTVTAEKSLYGASERISELQNSVAQKRIELEQLKRERSLSAIVEAQMPSLHEWTILEGDHSSSLSGATKALQDASLRLPVSGNVRADARELNEALDSATDSLEALSCVGKFLPQAEGIEDILTELVRVISLEKALIEECGDRLFAAHELQVVECSIRSQLIQLTRQSS